MLPLMLLDAWLLRPVCPGQCAGGPASREALYQDGFAETSTPSDSAVCLHT